LLKPPSRSSSVRRRRPAPPVAAAMLNKLLKMANFRDDEAGYRGVLIDESGGDNLIATNRDNKNTVDAEILMHPNPRDVGMEAFAMWPSDIELSVPKDWKAGDKVPAAGPHGRIHFELPQNCTPGTNMRFRLKPAPDMRVEVPQGIPPGRPMVFERQDGTRIQICVPPGKRPGETFEVTPPALMVLVPEEAKEGDLLVFCLPGPPLGQWFKARVPESLQLGRYFAARLPPPDVAQVKGGSPKANAVANGVAKGGSPKANNEADQPLAEGSGAESAEDGEAPVE